MKKVLVLLISLFVLTICKAQDTTYTYLASYDSVGIIVNRYYSDVDSVKVVLNKKFENFKKDGVYFDMYIEKKRVNKRGKAKPIKLRY